MALVTVTTDFTGKIAGSLTVNRNTAKGTGFSSTIMTAPTPYGAWTSDYNQVQQDNLKVLGTGYHQMYNTATSVAYSLYSFDIIAAIEKQYGQTLWRGKTLLAEKIAIAKEITSNIVCSASGKAPSALKTLYLSAFNGTVYDTPVSASASAVTTLKKTVTSNYIDSNGYVHFPHGDVPADDHVERVYVPDREYAFAVTGDLECSAGEMVLLHSKGSND